MASLCCVLNLDVRRISQIFGHSEEDRNKHGRSIPEDLSAETISELRSKGDVMERALSDARRRAVVESVPMSNRSYLFLDRATAIGDFIPLKFKPRENLPSVLLSHVDSGIRGVDEPQSRL